MATGPAYRHSQVHRSRIKPNNCSIVERVGQFEFAPLVTKKLDLVAELDVLFLRPEPPGSVGHGGDIDNRIKTLLDSLRIPRGNELSSNDSPRWRRNSVLLLAAGRCPSYAFVNHVGSPAEDRGHVMLVIDLHVIAAVPTMANIGIA
jgi:hypothetical protein